jgi:hypothetical protein
MGEGKMRKFLAAVVLTSMMAITGLQAQSDRHRVGAVCNDGTSSSATGSGACSHHGGVSCWKYSDGTCTKP